MGGAHSAGLRGALSGPAEKYHDLMTKSLTTEPISPGLSGWPLRSVTSMWAYA
jgi:hypothetical protein